MQHGTFRRCWLLIRGMRSYTTEQPAYFVILWITQRVRLTLPLTFRTGLPCTRHHQDRCSSQLLQICSCVRGRPRRDPKTSSCDHSLVATACCRHGQLASHVMAACFTRHGNVVHSECRLTFVPGYDDESVGDARCVTTRTSVCPGRSRRGTSRAGPRRRRCSYRRRGCACCP